MKSNIEMAIRVLSHGNTLEHDGNIYAMDDEGYICVMMKKNNEDIAIRIDCDVSSLYKIAEDIGENDLWMKCCEISLTEINSKNR